MTAIALRARRAARLVPSAGAGLALTLTLVTGAVVILAGAAANDAYLVPALARARAHWLPGPLARLAVPVSLDGVFAWLAAMTVAYAAAVLLAPRVALRWILLTAALLQAAFALAPPLLSTDVFNYIDVGHISGRLGLDPYSVPPVAGPHTGLFVFLHWRHAVTVYGPLFTLLARLTARMTVAHALLTFKAIGAGAAFGCTALAAWIAGRRGHSPQSAAAMFGLNPLVLVWTVGGGHNDTLMMLFVLAGFALVLGARPAAGAATAVAASAIKLSAGLALPFVVWSAPRGQRLRALAGALGALAVLVAVAYVAFPDHATGMVSGLRRQQQLDGIASVPTDVAYLVGLPAVTPHEMTVFHVLLALWLAGCGIALLRGGDPLALAGWALLGVVLASSWLLPWYPIWPLALAACAGDRRLLIASSAVGASYVIGHVPLT